jgi:transposase
MPPTQYFVGIDLHKAVLQVCVLDAEGEIVREERRRIGSLEAGLEEVARLGRWSPSRMAVEAIGLNRWFVNACHQSGFDLIVVDAGRLNLKALGKKTDRRDALEIARRLRMGDLDRHAKTYYPSDDEYSVRQLERVRHELVQLRTHLGNRIGSLLDAYKHPRPSGAMHTRPSLAFLKAVRLPAVDLDRCIEALARTLAGVQESVVQLTKRIEERAREPKVAALQSMVPQVGPQTALTVVYELGDVARFANARAAASYSGLVPRVANSADVSHHGRITKRGNVELRWILNQCAVRLLATHPLVRSWAKPRWKRMHKNKVRTTLARRLLVAIYSVLRNGEVFSMERCLGMA